MAVTGTKYVLDLCTAALKKARIVGMGDTAEAEEIADAMSELNMMLKDWQTETGNVWTLTGGSLTLTTANNYTLSPVRPLSIHNARFKKSGIETPLTAITRREYDELPNKATTGQPVLYYYDRQKEAAKLYIWPALSVADGETIEYTYTRELEDIASTSDVVDLPGEMWSCAVYNLAARLAETYGLNRPDVQQRAMYLYERAMAFDQEESVFFAGGGE